MTNNNDCSGVSYGTKRSRPRLVMNVDALSAEERAYLLGLFLTDGNLTRVKYSARVHFSLASNEVELAERVSGFLRRLGLHSDIKDYSGSRNYVVVRAYGVGLLSYFPDKKRLISLDSGGFERWLNCEGLYGELGVPFIASLLDGDGYVSASYDRASIFPCVEVCWSFVQKKLGPLIDYIVRYVEGLTPYGTSVYLRKGDKGRIVNISASGRKALLGRGVAKWSWKISGCMGKVEKMRREVADLRSRFYTTPQVARRLHISRDAVLWWCNHGSVRSIRVRGNRYGAGGKYYFIIPVEEVERLEAQLVKREKRKRSISVGGRFLSVKEASIFLGVTRQSAWWFCKNGKLEFVPVLTVGGKKKYLIPVEAVERFKRGLGKSKDR